MQPVTTNNNAPGNSDDKFCVIMELSQEEKRELISMWKERESCSKQNRRSEPQSEN